MTVRYLVDGRNVTKRDPATSGLAIADAAADLDPEIVSIYYGEDVKADAAQHAAELIGGRLPMSDVNVVDGGQPVYYYMISFE